MINSLLGEFTINWSTEWLGIVASAFILVSFLFSKQLITRLINMVGCLAFVIYATVFIQSFSTAFMNGALFIVHIVFIVKDYVARKKKANQTKTEDEQATADSAVDENTKQE